MDVKCNFLYLLVALVILNDFTCNKFAQASQILLKYGQEISYGNFFQLPGFFLDAETISPASNAFDSVECALHCVLTTRCISYNYKNGGSGGTNCQLMSVDRFFNSTALRKDSQCDYYYVKRKCDNNPCLNNGTCRSSIQVDNFTCECTASFKGQNCSEPICSQEVAHGMESKAISDSQLSVSSYYNNDARYGQTNGRLNKNTWPYGAQVSASDPAPWFQIDLLTTKVITAVGIQGYGAPDGGAWVKTYQISYSIDGTSWKWYQESPGVNKTLPANVDAHAEVRTRLNMPIKANKVQIWAKTCQSLCTFRLELYGCNL